jgi:hypothetical protein
MADPVSSKNMAAGVSGKAGVIVMSDAHKARSHHMHYTREGRYIHSAFSRINTTQNIHTSAIVTSPSTPT